MPYGQKKTEKGYRDFLKDLKEGTIVFTDAGIFQLVGIENGSPYGLLNSNSLVSLDSLRDDGYEVYGWD